MISLTLDESTKKELARIRDETGLPISQQVDLMMKGYSVVKRGSENIPSMNCDECKHDYKHGEIFLHKYPNLTVHFRCSDPYRNMVSVV